MKRKTFIILISILLIFFVIISISGCSPSFVGLKDDTSSDNTHSSDNSSNNTTNQPSAIAPPASYNITIKEGNPLPEGAYTFPETVERVETSVVSLYVTDPETNSKSAGSAVFYGKDEETKKPVLVTCCHVIDYALTTNKQTKITAVLHDGTEVECKILGGDDEEDLAILTILDNDLQTIEGKYSTVSCRNKDENIKTGEDVFAIGNPLGTLGGSVTKGIVSGKERVINMDGVSMNLLQIDVAVNQGNSGGALFDIAGNLIGIVNAKSTGSGVEGIGYAIHINDVQRVANSIIRTSGTEQYNHLGYVEGKVRLGVTVRIAKGQTNSYEYLINELNPFGTVAVYNKQAADGNKIAVGDYINAVKKKDGAPILFDKSNSLGDFIKDLKVGDQIIITIERRQYNIFGQITTTNTFDVELTMQQYVFGYTP